MDIDVLHLAKLSCLRIEENQIADFEKRLGLVISKLDEMPNVNLEIPQVNPSRPMTLRPDKVGENKLTRDSLMANAPKVQAGCFVVPKTVE